MMKVGCIVRLWFFVSLTTSVFFLPCQNQVQANEGGFSVISDVDDTLKITNVPSYRHAVSNLFFGKQTYLGMRELFQAFNHHTNSFVYLSGSPMSFAKKAETMLVNL